MCKKKLTLQKPKKENELVFAKSCADCFFSDIWNKFLDFESNIGDLSSIIKVEKRRSSVLNQVGSVPFHRLPVPINFNPVEPKICDFIPFS